MTEKDHRKLDQEFRSWQSNVLPLDAARNEGRFYGLLVKMNRPLTVVQRTGFLLLAVAFLLGASLEVTLFVRELRLHLAGTGDGFPYTSLVGLLPAGLFFLLGFKLCLAGLTAPSLKSGRNL